MTAALAPPAMEGQAAMRCAPAVLGYGSGDGHAAAREVDSSCDIILDRLMTSH